MNEPDPDPKPDKELPAVIHVLIRWRKANGLSQRGASEILTERGVDLPVSAIQQYEQAVRRPSRFAAKALAEFLEANPKVPSRRYPPGRKPKT